MFVFVRYLCMVLRVRQKKKFLMEYNLPHHQVTQIKRNVRLSEYFRNNHNKAMQTEAYITNNVWIIGPVKLLPEKTSSHRKLDGSFFFFSNFSVYQELAYQTKIM